MNHKSKNTLVPKIEPWLLIPIVGYSIITCMVLVIKDQIVIGEVERGRELGGFPRERKSKEKNEKIRLR